MRILPTLLLALCVPLTGCSHLVWYGRGPQRRAKVEVWERGGRQHVLWNGRPQRRYHAIGLTELRISPDGTRLAYPARQGARWVVVVDGREGRRWLGVGGVRFSANSRRVAYVAQGPSTAGRPTWRVVADGRPGPVVDAVLRDTLRFSPDSRRLAYVARRGGATRVYVDHKPGPAFRGVSQLRLARGRVGYVGRRPGGHVLVIDGLVGDRYDRVRELTFSRDGKRYAYLARRGSSWVAVVDARTSPPYEGLRGMTFSADGRHVAYAAQQGGQARVIRDGTPGPLYDGVRYATLAFDAAGRILYVARSGSQYRVVRGGQAGPAYDRIERPTISGDRWGYVARRNKHHWLVLQGRARALPRNTTWAGDLRLPAASRRYAVLVGQVGRTTVLSDRGARAFDLVVEGTLTFDGRGQRWACLAGVRKTKHLFIALEGRGRRAFDTEELTAAVMKRRRMPTATLRRWVRAELERGR